MAVDPLTAKILAKVAMQAATDSESRKRILFMILAPVLGLLLLIAFILYLITSPFSVLSQWLIGDEVNVVEDFQKQYGYNQQLGIYEKDYIDGSGQSYEGVVFTDGATEVVYYNQLDERWADLPYGTDNIGGYGCGPTSMAIVVSSLTDQTVDPPTMAEWAYQNGYWCSGNGSYHSLIPGAAEGFGLQWESISTAATTKAYSTQLVLMDLIALYLGDLLGTIEKTEYDTILHELEALPEKLERVLASIEDVKYFASRYFNHDSIFFIGRNLDYAMGLEGSLKLKEISYIHSEAYASGELKHGTISLIEPGTLVVALGTYEPLFDKAMSNVVEVKARGAEVLALATEPLKEKMDHTADSVIAVPETHPVVQPSLGVVPLQLFAYYVALQRGCDIDKPRNLAKSVTVE